MPESLSDLEHQRNAILQQMLRLPDFRSGSITAARGTCGKANCRCHQPNQPGHGPNYRLTRKVKGKTVTETFATSPELRKAEREVEAYHRFRHLAQELLEINEKICRVRPVEQEPTPAKKNGGNHPLGSGSRSRASIRAGVAGRRAVWSAGPRSGGDGGSLQPAPGRIGGAEPVAGVRSSQLGKPPTILFLRP